MLRGDPGDQFRQRVPIGDVAGGDLDLRPQPGQFGRQFRRAFGLHTAARGQQHELDQLTKLGAALTGTSPQERDLRESIRATRQQLLSPHAPHTR